MFDLGRCLFLNRTAHIAIIISDNLQELIINLSMRGLKHLNLLFVLAVLLVLATPASCSQSEPIEVIGKLLDAFGKCGLKAGLIDPNKLNRLLQLKQGFRTLDPK